MRKTVYTLAAILSPIAMLCSCSDALTPESSTSKEVNPAPVAALFAHPQTLSKTVLNSDWSVTWEDSDDMTVFNAGAGETSYSDNCRFSMSDASSGKFVKDVSETSKSLISGKESYDWYVSSPWMQYGSSPAGTKGYTVNRAPFQKGYGSTSHISESDILVGKALAVSSDATPSLILNHVCALMKFTVVNNSGSASTITGLTLDATSGGTYITGSFSMDWKAGTEETPCLSSSVMGSAKAYTCALSVVENAGTEESPDYQAITQTVASGESVDLYMVVAPFTIPAGGKIGLEITGSNGICSLEKTVESAISFKAGTYNTATIPYENPEKVLFMENFGTAAVGYAKVASYGKSGLYTLYPDDKAGYGYGVSNNASFQIATYTGQTTTGAYVRFPKKGASVAIKGINLHGATKLRFSYLKDSANVSETALSWRFTGTTDWTALTSSTSTGVISYEFTIENPDNKTIDIQLQNSSDVTNSKYPTVDNLKLVALQ